MDGRTSGAVRPEVSSEVPAGSAGGSDVARSGSRLRTDIEGLRAVAVVAVVAYHLQVRGFSGGFSGVDVFFVISGYLITGHLVSEAAQGRGIGFRDFYARRARRILPVATVVIIATLLAGAWSQNPLDFAQTTPADARSAALFFSNVRFASLSTDYLADALGGSLFQQFWSLSVEEQFYLLWPTLMFVVVAGLAGRRRSVRRPTAVALGLVIAGSFALSVVASRDDPIPGFFLLRSRAWELAVGALLAVGAQQIGRVVRPVRSGVAVVGLGGIVFAIVAYGHATTWPGVAAAVPVIGTAMVIAAGIDSSDSLVARGLALRPMQAIGRCSYSIYLWHWPLALLIAEKQGYSTAAAILVAGLTYLLAIGSYGLIEHPVRSSAWLRSNTIASLAMGLGLIVLAVAESFLAALFVPDFDTGRASGAAPHVAGAPPEPTDFVPSDLEPPLIDGTALVDPSAERNIDCGDVGQCSYGDPAADVHVVLFGDSHVGQWAGAIEVLAETEGWHVDRLTQGGCSTFAPSTGPATGVGPGCRTWQEDRWGDIQEMQPDLLILANHSQPQFDGDPQVWERGVEEALTRAPQGTAVAVLAETPVAAERVPQCLAVHLDEVAPCEPEWPTELNVAINERLAGMTRAAGAAFVDLNPILCLDERCPAVAGNLLVYQDRDHITTTFSRSRAAEVGSHLRSLLR
jgi:peptidoglycan/LPS O-acetylase OafA/YrhL